MGICPVQSFPPIPQVKYKSQANMGKLKQLTPFDIFSLTYCGNGLTQLHKKDFL